MLEMPFSSSPTELDPMFTPSSLFMSWSVPGSGLRVSNLYETLGQLGQDEPASG